MPGIRRILPLAISGLLLIPNVHAAAKWDCRATVSGEWECLKDGIPVAAESGPGGTITPERQADEPAEEQPTSREESMALPGPTPLVAADPTAEADSQADADVPSPPPGGTGNSDTPTADTTAQPATEASLTAQETGEAATGTETEAPTETLTPAASTDRAGPGKRDTSDNSASVKAAREAPAQPTADAGAIENAKRRAEPEMTAPTQATMPESSTLRAENKSSDTTDGGAAASTTPAVSSQPAADAPSAAVETGNRSAKAASETVPPAIAAPASPVLPEATAADPRLDRGLNWNQCSGGRLPLIARPAPADDDSTRIEADAADLYRNENRAEFAGNVRIEHANERLEADRVDYDRNSNTLDAEGRVYLEQPGLRISGDRLHYQLDQRSGNTQQAEFRLTDAAARGTAASAEMLNAEQSRYSQVTYTTCPPGNSDWLINAGELEIDQETGVGVARDASVSFKGVPFIYLPYATFPIDDRRKSGFLPPSIGTSENTGADISIPYYLNIAPAMDATLTPRIMSKRGLMLGGEFRYLTEKSKGVVQAELLPNDSERATGQSSSRGALNIKTDGRPGDRWYYDVDLNYVSDDDYLDDLGNSLAATSARHQERRGDIRYQGDGWSLLGRAQHFQTIDRSIAITDRPYYRLPQLLLNLEKPDQAMGLTYHLQSEYVQFDHSSESKVKGRRLDLQPGISLPLRQPWGFITPKLSLRHTRYDLENQTPGLDSSPSRTLPTLSLDGGLYFDRPANWFGNAITQTLEPRLFYLYTPYEDQNAIPDLDTSELGFSFANLFRENRFSGGDKVGDANQLTTALTTRSLDRASGEELLRASIGQIFYFRDRDVQLQSTGAAVNDDSSAIVAEASARLSRSWRLQGGLQWNPHELGGRTERSALGLHYDDRKGRILNLTYRYTESSIEQTDLSARWPVSSRVHLVGRWNYSLLHEKSMERFAGIEYDSCCWITRFVVRDYRSDANSEGNLALFLQLELKGLTSLGDKIDQLLERGILGYRSDD
ncbi:MAG: LPS assembly protein LptD [Sedimenticola sp.]|nr:LPS assembly protein LptD [Sedimenticola sp.]